MRGRPKRKRIVNFFPEITYFKPVGIFLRDLQQETLSFDEVEAIRLYNLEDLDQKKAAEKMGISRVTFLRIIHKANKKIGRCLIYGKAIKIKGGDFMPRFDGTGPQGQGPKTGRRGQTSTNRPLGSENCVCPQCNQEVPHRRGTPCSETKCPKCGTPMRGIFCK